MFYASGVRSRRIPRSWIIPSPFSMPAHLRGWRPGLDVSTRCGSEEVAGPDAEDACSASGLRLQIGFRLIALGLVLQTISLPT